MITIRMGGTWKCHFIPTPKELSENIQLIPDGGDQILFSKICSTEKHVPNFWWGKTLFQLDLKISLSIQIYKYDFLLLSNFSILLCWVKMLWRIALKYLLIKCSEKSYSNIWIRILRLLVTSENCAVSYSSWIHIWGEVNLGNKRKRKKRDSSVCLTILYSRKKLKIHIQPKQKNKNIKILLTHKKNAFLPFPTTWMTLENIMLGKESHR